MKQGSLRLLIAFIFFLSGIYFTTRRQNESREVPEQEDHAMEMFDWWYSQRALPYDYIPAGAYQRAVETHKRLIKNFRSVLSTATTDQWHSIGPNNIGGRILALAVNPVNPSIIWAGSSSGGLWKSTTGGEGASGWTWVNTGGSVVSASAIAIDPTNPALMYLGTGELSFYQTGLIGTPGARSSYGVGILRSTDSGATWLQTDLNWTIPQVTAVQKIIINPLNTSTLFAATSEGVYKSTDAGAHWTQSTSNLMAIDIVMSPDDTTSLYASFGNLNSTPTPGIFKTTDAGLTWSQLTNGLPSTNFGRTALAISPAAPATIYASVSNGNQNSGAILGLYSSTDRGASWTLVNTTNYVSSQGWYDNVVAANPAFADSIYCAGLDVYGSVNGGSSLTPLSDWTAGYLGYIATGGSEGTPTYVHADQHAIVINPFDRRTIYIGSDGGVFKTTNGGATFYGINGGLVTTQFYNGFCNSQTDSTLSLGGLQDNGVIKYFGSTAWEKVDGGDGGWSAIDPTNPQILYDEYVYLAISKSTDGGNSFFSISGGLPSESNDANFIAPFVLSHASPKILYAGARNVFKTTNGGNNWSATNNGVNLNGTKIATIGISWTSPDTLMAGTGSSASQSPVFQIFASINGGTSWMNVTDSLPARYPTDIAFDPTNSATAYVTFSGYGTPHLYKTTNLGQTWTNITTGVDVPHQSVTVDPDDPVNIYAGTDLGVYHSSDAGMTWEPLTDGMNPAMVLALAVSPTNGTIRVVTFGSGVYERKLIRTPQITLLEPTGGEIFAGRQIVQIQWLQKYLTLVDLDYSLDGGATWQTITDSIPVSTTSYNWNTPDTVTSLGKIRVRDAITGTPFSVNDSTFSIIQNSDVIVGWNLLSLKVMPPDRSKLTLFPGAASPAFIYQLGYTVSETLMTGSGFWLKYDAPALFTYIGDSILTDTVPVVQGWNMIGAISQTIPASSIRSIPDSILNLPLFGYFGAYYTADSLVPGYGYWLNVKAPGEIILNASASQQKNIYVINKEIASSLTFTDQSHRHQTLFLASGETGAGNTELPPLPPEQSFDIRFTSQKFIEQLPQHSNVYSIALSGVRYPLLMKWTAASSFHGVINIIFPDGRKTALTGDNIVIPTPVDRIRIEYLAEPLAAIPSAFRLEQNFPNPFNPSTTIRYAVRAATHIRLVVYNIAGQIVATLADRNETAGIHEVQWDASEHASGVYLYRLYASDSPEGTDVKAVGTGKMILLR